MPNTFWRLMLYGWMCSIMWILRVMKRVLNCRVGVGESDRPVDFIVLLSLRDCTLLRSSTTVRKIKYRCVTWRHVSPRESCDITDRCAMHETTPLSSGVDHGRTGPTALCQFRVYYNRPLGLHNVALLVYAHHSRNDPIILLHFNCLRMELFQPYLNYFQTVSVILKTTTKWSVDHFVDQYSLVGMVVKRTKLICHYSLLCWYCNVGPL